MGEIRSKKFEGVGITWPVMLIVMSCCRTNSRACISSDPTTAAPYPHSPFASGIAVFRGGAYSATRSITRSRSGATVSGPSERYGWIVTTSRCRSAPAWKIS